METTLINTVIENKIHIIRGQKVMIDFDLASLYEVPTKALNQSVKRNILRFPPHFMFQLNEEEWNNLRSQIVTAKPEIRKTRSSKLSYGCHKTRQNRI